MSYKIKLEENRMLDNYNIQKFEFFLTKIFDLNMNTHFLGLFF